VTIERNGDVQRHKKESFKGSKRTPGSENDAPRKKILTYRKTDSRAVQRANQGNLETFRGEVPMLKS